MDTCVRIVIEENQKDRNNSSQWGNPVGFKSPLSHHLFPETSLFFACYALGIRQGEQ